MREQEAGQKHEVGTAISIMDRLKANAEAEVSKYPQLLEDIQQREKLQKELPSGAKVNVLISGVAYLDHAIEHLAQMEDPSVKEVRVHSNLLQSTIVPEPAHPGEAPTLGALPIDHEIVQLRLAHLYALAGAVRPMPTEDDIKKLYFELKTETNLAPDISIIEERTVSTVAIRFQREAKSS